MCPLVVRVTRLWTASCHIDAAPTGRVLAPWRRRAADEKLAAMCRNIKPLANFAPPATDADIRASALQFVRKLSGMNHPSQANQPVFDRVVDDVASAAYRLVHVITTQAPPRNREDEARKASEHGNESPQPRRSPVGFGLWSLVSRLSSLARFSYLTLVPRPG